MLQLLRGFFEQEGSRIISRKPTNSFEVEIHWSKYEGLTYSESKHAALPYKSYIKSCQVFKYDTSRDHFLSNHFTIILSKATAKFFAENVVSERHLVRI